MTKRVNFSDELSVKEADRTTWDKAWKQVNFSNLLQSWEYGEVKSVLEKWVAHRFLIVDANGNFYAMAQVLIRSMPIVGKVARLNRGPLLVNSELQDPNREERSLKSIEVLVKELRHLGCRLTLMAPELETDDIYGNRHLKGSFRINRFKAWGSARLFLLKSEDEIYTNLKGKWRNMLRKAQKSNISVVKKELNSSSVEELVSQYTDFKEKKGFSGLSKKLLREICLKNGDDWHTIVLESFDRETSRSLGFLVSVRHGDTSTYLIGFTNEQGRRTNANYLMLWASINDAKAAGCSWFDLGGITDNTLPGIAQFKNGIRADRYGLIGEYFRIKLI